MKKNLKKGFTITELIVVIVIIGILAAILIPNLTAYIEKTRKTKYLQTARNTLTEYILENDTYLEDDTYFFVRDEQDENNLAWYRFENGALTSLEEEPTLDINHKYPITRRNSQITANVVIYRPLVTDVVAKLNDLLVDASATNFELIATAGKELTDLEMDIISCRETDYKFAYSRATNKVFIMNSDENSVLYSNTSITSVPSDQKALVGKNINKADDLVEVATISNLHEETVPTAENIYVSSNNNKSPLVILNLNKNIDMAENYEFKPIANYELLGPAYSTLSNWHQIHVLLNGNDHTISNMYDALIGVMAPGSIVRDVIISYNMPQSNPFSRITTPNNYATNFHYGLIARFVIKTGAINTWETVKIDNIKLTGQSYWRYTTNGKSPKDTAMVIGGVFNSGASGSVKLISFSNLDLFTSEGDYCGFFDSTPETFAVLVGNPEKNQFEYSNIVYDTTTTGSLYHGDFYTVSEYMSYAQLPYYGIVA